MSQIMSPYSRLGLSRTKFSSLLRHHQRKASQAGAGDAYLDSKQGIRTLAKLVSATQSDPDLCGLIVTAIARIYQESAEKEARIRAREKKYRRNSFGMF